MMTRHQQRLEGELLNAEEEHLEYSGSEEDLEEIFGDKVDEKPDDEADETLFDELDETLDDGSEVLGHAMPGKCCSSTAFMLPLI